MKFWFVSKIQLKTDIFDHSEQAKDEIWQNSDIFSLAENLAQNLRVLNTQDMHRMKFGKYQKFSVALKIWLKNESFDHSKPAKDEIWQNPEKFGFVLKIWLKNEIFDHCRPVKDEIKFGKIQKLSVVLKIWPEREFDHSWPAKDEILQNPEILIRVENLAQKLTFVTTQDMRRMRLDKIQKFSVASNIWLKIETFDHSGPAKDEIWQHPNILSRVENLAQKWDFWSLWTCQLMKFGKILKF